jgi:hypothetical protein
MADSYSPQLDTWLDQEISALLETVESNVDGRGRAAIRAAQSGQSKVGRWRERRGPLPRPWPWAGLRVHGIARPRSPFGTLRTTLVYCAFAVALGGVVGWIVTSLTTP